MALTHEYGLMLIYWSTWLVLFLKFHWNHMVLLDIMVHAFFMWMGYTVQDTRYIKYAEQNRNARNNRITV
jgi:hypothetical protein